MSVEAKLSRLSIDLKQSQSPRGSKGSLSGAPGKTPDSWEDEIEDDDTPVEAPGPTLIPFSSRDDAPAPPPPTPISPHHAAALASVNWSSASTSNDSRPSSGYSSTSREGSDRRPEKTTATANRLIAGALGVRAPKKTEEQKQYDRAVKEAEIKRKNREKDAKENERLADEKARAAVWDG